MRLQKRLAKRHHRRLLRAARRPVLRRPRDLDRAFPPPLPEKLAVSPEVRRSRRRAAARLRDAGRLLAARRHASIRSTRNSSSMLVAYEDKRFWDHDGVDPLALLRAAAQFAGNGRIVSGGSTLSMQLARLIEPRESRSVGSKITADLPRHPDRAAARASAKFSNAT